MGALPTIKRFLTEDYPTESGWIGTLLYPLNLLLTTLYSNLNNGLTIANNFLSQLKVISVDGTSSSTSFPWNFPATTPVGVSIVGCYDTSTQAPIAATCSWSYSSGVVTINSVTGLTAGHTYNCTFIVWGG